MARPAPVSSIVTMTATPTLAFLREVTRTFHTTGAIAPSGHSLACRLAEPLRAARSGPLSVLEVGAGTGTVTRVLARLIGPSDRLDVVEINPRFVGVLTGLLRTDPALAAVAEQVRILPESVTELELGEGRYDVIVSCLPFTNFAPETVRSILAQYRRALVPGGRLTWFGYLGTRPLRSLFGSRAEAARHRAVAAELAAFEGAHHSERRVVWDNVPPARVFRLRPVNP